VLYWTVIVRLRFHQPTIDHVAVIAVLGAILVLFVWRALTRNLAS